MKKRNEDQRKAALKKARDEYEKKRVVRVVSFNLEKEAKLLEIANSKPSFSSWVKDKLRENSK